MSLKIEDIYFVLDKVKFNYKSKRANKKSEHNIVDEVKFGYVDGNDVWFELTRKSFFKPAAVHDIMVNVAVCITFTEKIPEDFSFDDWFNGLSEDYIDGALYDVFAHISMLMSKLTAFGHKTPLITAPTNYLAKFKD